MLRFLSEVNITQKVRFHSYSPVFLPKVKKLKKVITLVKSF